MRKIAYILASAVAMVGCIGGGDSAVVDGAATQRLDLTEQLSSDSAEELAVKGEPVTMRAYDRSGRLLETFDAVPDGSGRYQISIDLEGVHSIQVVDDTEEREVAVVKSPRQVVVAEAKPVERAEVAAVSEVDETESVEPVIELVAVVTPLEVVANEQPSEQTEQSETAVVAQAVPVVVVDSKKRGARISEREKRRSNLSLYTLPDGEYDVETHRERRGLVALDNAVVPKGQWIVGANASYSTHNNSDYTFAVVNGIRSVGYGVSASPVIAYTFKNNMSAGVRFEYERSLLNLESALLSIGEEGSGVEIGISDYYALQQSFSGMLIFRQYIPLGHSKRFSLFGELQLEYGGVRSKFAYDQPVSGTFSKGYNVSLGVVPGLVAWATNDVALEVSIGLIGVSYSHSKQIHNQVYYGETNSSSLNYGLNLFSIGLGVAFYL